MEFQSKTFNIWIGLRSSDFQIFDKLVDINQIVSIDIDDTRNIPIISQELLTKKRMTWSNEELLRVEKLEIFKKLIRELETSTKKVNIYCYHSLPVIERIARKNKHIRIYASPINLKRKLDDKLTFLKFLKDLKLKSVYSLIFRINETNYHKLKRALGLPFVIKERIGASGGSTYFVRNEEDLMKLKKIIKTGVVLASKYIRGPSFNINAFIDKKIQLSPPSIQITGIPECSCEKFTYCGNDFSSFNTIDSSIKDAFFDTTKKIGVKMQKMGYYGLFGIDFVYDPKNKILYPLEINPRFQGSTPLLMRYQTFKELDRLIELYENPNKIISYNYPVDVSFFLLHNINGKRMKVKRHFNSGIYKLYFRNREINLKYLGNQYSFPRNKRELLILGCPKVGTTVEPGAGILRIEFREDILNYTNMYLRKRYSELARVIYKSLWGDYQLCVG
ncbi:ATP-grasp domain-containing protein [Patescibacteria group bacterium]|nr:ATP-grasp domain-containing protein [Patescibacteria group bacterium]